MNDDRPFSTLVELLRWRARHHADEPLYTFLADGENQEIHLTYGELDRQAQAIAAKLQSSAVPASRALLLYQPGLEFISAFFGCLYAGIIAVPAYPPRNPRHVPRIQTIATDAEASLCLTSSTVFGRSRELFGVVPGLERMIWLATDEIQSEALQPWRPVDLKSGSLAYLQYTSGSTSTPKGVMVSHGNLLHNLGFLCHGRGHTKIVSWLPFFHDMGLIYAILQALYGGFPCILMAPPSFLQRPFRWLQALSRYGASTAIAPNFAYELCAQKVSEAEKQTLDLSRWTMALNAAEPVRLETLERFAAAFASCGFRADFLKPAYGLAEATLGVSIFAQNRKYCVKTVDKAAFARHRVIDATPATKETCVLVGCGQGAADLKIAIVNPETLRRCAPDEVGEIWLASPSVAAGYWKRPQETEETFRAVLADTGEGPFLRTGDLGYFMEEELFITGRLKDMIIVRGANHYPQDIERTAQMSHAALQPDAGAAFAVEMAGEERVVVVQEMIRHHKANLEEVIAAVREAVTEEHGVQIYAIVLVKPLSVPKTSSGKIQRRAARQMFLEGSFEVEREWRAVLDLESTKSNACVTASSTSEGRSEIAALGSTGYQPVPSGNLPDGTAATSMDGSSADSTATPAAIPVGRLPTEAGRLPAPPVFQAGSMALEQPGLLKTWLIARLSEMLKIPAPELDPRQPFSRYGLDSLGAVGLAGELQEKVGRPLPSSLLFDYPTVESLIKFLVRRPESPLAPDDKSSAREPIAIIGLGCRFPGANNPQEFWELLRQGVDAISEVPRDRWDADALYDPRPATPGKMNARWGGFLKNVDQFAADFFEISPREARQMDPQQRLVLEVAWEALENAGLPPMQLAGSRTGVFVGVSSFDYWLLRLRERPALDAYAGTGIAHSIVANRVSYFLDLKGPSLAVDTACSSSLVALHQACESLRRGESNLALAGGVNLILSPELTIALSQARMMASDGRCKTFDSRADGYVRGEGCGIFVLKRLAEARRDGDPILALIQGSAINQDGRSNGLTAPNGPAQEAVVQAALQNAGVAPQEITCVECHGTGTSLGDPQELDALQHILGRGRTPDQKCWIGSVKTNIGHLEAAAGIAGCVKVVLSLLHREIPPHLHFQSINPHIRLEDTPFQIPVGLTPWPGGGRRFAGVSSFGFGGTNAHVILSEAPEPVLDGTGYQPVPSGNLPDGTGAVSMNNPGAGLTATPAAIPVGKLPTGAGRLPAPPISEKGFQASLERPRHLLTVSAKTADALKASVGLLAKHLELPACGALENVCFTANAGRSHFDHRLALVADTLMQAREELAEFCTPEGAERFHHAKADPNQRPRIAFLFTGQGSQSVGMGRMLYETQPTFRKTLQRCDEILQPLLGCSLLSLIYPEPGKPSPLDQTIYAQPALFSLEYALAELWQSWGIRPDAVLGHSVGEYVAACVAGVFDLEAGLKLIATRARLMHSLPPSGQMAVVFASAEKVAPAIAAFAGEVSIAAINGPAITVISGAQERLLQILAQLATEGVEHQMLVVSHAFHSPLMEPILADFRRVSSEVRYHSPKIPLVSNVTGDWFAPEAVPDADYWTRHIRQPVQFARGVSTLDGGGYTVFLECGPTPTLLAMGKRCVPAGAKAAPKKLWLPSLRKGLDDWNVLLETLAQLYLAGAAVDWKGFDRDYVRQKVWLPTYPFSRSRFWISPAPAPSPATVEVDVAEKVWPAVVAAGTQQAQDGAPASILEKERKRLAALNELSAAYMLRALDVLGLAENDSKLLPLTEWAEQRRVPARLVDVVGSWLSALRRAGRLRRTAQGYEMIRPGAESRSEKALLGSTGYQPVPSGNLPDGTGVASMNKPGAGFVPKPAAIPVGRLPTGAGKLPAPPISQTDASPAQEEAWAEAARLWEGEMFFPELVRKCGESLADAITGKVDPLTLLFPGGSWAAVEKIYRDSTLARYCNGILARAVQALAHGARPERPLRILEVGGGTGGSTAHLLPALRPQKVRYTFTDVGPSFVQQAQQRFREFPFVSYQTLDLERSPESQGFVPGSFDLVIAANVLHATRRLRETLERVRSLLAPPGHLLIWEATAPQPWLDITFGLLEGWHRFEDRDLRSDQPLLPVGRWTEILQATGFNKVSAFPSPDSFGLGQSVIAAQAAGIAARRSEAEPIRMLPSESNSRLTELVRDLFYEIQWRAKGEDLDGAMQSAPSKSDRDMVHDSGGRADLQVCPTESRSGRDGRGTWLLFADASGLAEKLAALLEEQGEYPILVWPSGGAESNGKKGIRIDPADATDWVWLGQEIGADRGHPPLRRAVHFWSLDATTPEQASVSTLENGQRLGCESVVHLVQQLAAHTPAAGPGKLIWLVTRGVQDLSQEERFEPALAQSPLWGIANVIGLEHPKLWGGIVDLEASPQGDEAAVLLRTLRDDGPEGQWAIRGTTRYVPRLSRQTLPAESKSPTFSANGTYLITGGLGGMGLPVARWMIERGARHFLLLGRSQLPLRTNWRQLAEGKDSVAEKIRAVLELENLGASIHLASADVANKEQLSGALAEFQAQSWPPIRGVIHAAGVLEDHAMVSLNRESLEATMRPKLNGSWLLHELLGGAPLDFFVLFSSAAAVLGSPGQANHAAANAFLDSLARFRRARALPAQSINWGPWGEVGAAARSRHKAKMMARGVGYLTTEIGLAALEAALTHGAVQTVVIPIQWSQFLEGGVGLNPFLSEFASKGSSTNEAAPVKRPTSEAKKESTPRTLEQIEAKLKEFAGTLLMLPVERIDPARPLIQLGFDSLMAVQLQNEIEANLGCHVPVNEIGQCSVAGLARRVVQESAAASKK